MNKRLEYLKHAPDAGHLLSQIGNTVAESGLEAALTELVNVRVSQINGCAFCLNVHTKAARAAEVGEQKLNVVAAWRESPQFSPRERAALAWAETLTLLAGGKVSDALYEETRLFFSETEIVNLTFAVAAINSWNRLERAFRGEIKIAEVAAGI
jgi:AhpD family alkylhydroperoxidase